MLLFAISFLSVFISSYFLTTIIAHKNCVLGFIYLFLTAFAQIVLTFEVLSLFTAINQFWVLAVNFLFLFGSIFLWHKKSRPSWNLDLVSFKNKVVNSLKLDKHLMLLCIGFAVFIISTIFLCLILPVTNADGQAYHVVRGLFWIMQGSLNHFDTADVRNLCLPINSEILYSWVFLFLKKCLFLGFFSFVGYILAIVSIYNIMGFLSFSTRKKLWVIFILSSFPCVMVQPSGTETDIIIAGLIASSLFLFWFGVKNNEKAPIFMSALAYALAVGTKTPSIIAIPAVGLFMLAICFYHKKFRPLAIFLAFAIVNFFIFSFYNYMLNFIQFNNFLGSQSFMVVSKNYYGLKGAFANLIKYSFMSVDFTGFKWSEYVNSGLVHLRSSILSIFALDYVKDGLYTTKYTVNNSLLEPLMGAGILGFLIYLPCLLWALIKPIFARTSKNTWFVFMFAVLYLINIFVLSYTMVYMSYSVRFIMFFMVLSSPVLGYSYFKGKSVIKSIIVLFALYYLILVSTNFWSRPLTKIIKVLRNSPSISSLRYRAICKDYEPNSIYSNSACPLRKVISEKLPPNSRILAFVNESDNIYVLKTMEFYGYKFDFRTLEDVDNIDFSQYDGLLVTSIGQRSSLVKYFNGFGKRSVYDGNMKISGCKYRRNPALSNIKKSNPQSAMPFEVICSLNNEFIKKEHFKFVDKAGVMKPLINDYVYYYVYKKD